MKINEPKENPLLLFIFLISLILRIIRIDYKTFSVDEAYAIFLISQNWDTFFRMLVDGPAGRFNFYFMILKAFVDIFGLSHLTVRIISALSGALLVFPLYYFSKSIADKYSALLSTILFSLSPLSLYYGQDARQYSEMFLVISIFYLIFIKTIFNPSLFPLLLLLYIISILVHPICYYFNFIIILALFLEKNPKYFIKNKIYIIISLFLFLFITLIHYKNFTSFYWNVMTVKYKIDFDLIKRIYSFMFSTESPFSIIFTIFVFFGILMLKLKVRTRLFLIFFLVPFPIPLYVSLANYFPHNFGIRYLSPMSLLLYIGFSNFLIYLYNRKNKKISSKFIFISYIFISFPIFFYWTRSYKSIYFSPVKGTEGSDYRGVLEFISMKNDNFPILLDPLRNIESRFILYHYLYIKDIEGKRPIISFRNFKYFKEKIEKLKINTFINFPITPEELKNFDFGKYRKLAWFLPLFYPGFKSYPWDIARFWVPEDWVSNFMTKEVKEKLSKRGYKVIEFVNALYIEHEYDSTESGFWEKVLEVSEIFIDAIRKLNPPPDGYFILVVLEALEKSQAPPQFISYWRKKYPEATSYSAKKVWNEYISRKE